MKKVLLLSWLNVRGDNSVALDKNIFHSTPWVFNLVEGLIQNGCKVDLISWSGRIEKSMVYSESNFNIYLIKSPSKAIQIISLFFNCYLQLKKIVEIEKYDIVHIQDSQRSAFVAFWIKKPKVITLHGTMKHHFQALGENNWFNITYMKHLIGEAYAIWQIKNIICVSPHVQQNINQKYNNLTQIDNPIGSLFFCDLPLKKSNNIIAIGSLTTLKKQHILLEILKIFTHTRLKLIYQHADKKYYNYLKQEIIANNLQDRVEFMGFKPQNEIVNELLDSFCLIHTSSYESFGMVIAEAMALGVPVIAGNSSGMKHVIENNVTGLLYSPDDTEDMISKYKLYLGNIILYNQVSSASKQIAYERWHPCKVAERTMVFYEKVIKNNEKYG